MSRSRQPDQTRRDRGMRPKGLDGEGSEVLTDNGN